MRLSSPYLKKSLEKVLKYRVKILENNPSGESDIGKPNHNDHPFGEEVKMIRQHRLSSKLLTPAEQDKVVVKYESGMTMAAIADEYGCHYTTVGRLLRKKGFKYESSYTDPFEIN